MAKLKTLLLSVIIGLSAAIIAVAFNNPVGNPPVGTGAIIGVGSGAPASSIYVDSAGKVGIGTANPGYPLHIYSSSISVGSIIESQLATGYAYQGYKNPDGRMIVGKEGSVGGGLLTGDSANAGIITTENNQPLQFGTNNIVRMTVLGGGNVGIGKTPGGYALDVNGNVNATVYYGSGANLTGIIGSRVARTTDTVYQANTDGYVNGFVVAANGIATITGYSDNSNPPAIIVDKDGYWAGGGGDVGASVGYFVKKNDYWRVMVSSSGYPQTITVWWTPLGS